MCNCNGQKNSDRRRRRVCLLLWCCSCCYEKDKWIINASMKNFLKMHFVFYVHCCHGKLIHTIWKKKCSVLYQKLKSMWFRVFFSEINESVIVLFVLVVRSQILKHRGYWWNSPGEKFCIAQAIYGQIKVCGFVPCSNLTNHLLQ